MFTDKESIRIAAKEAARFFLRQEITAASLRGSRHMWIDDDMYVDKEIADELRALGFRLEKNEENGEVRVSWDHE
jgi:hypothetical protein